MSLWNSIKARLFPGWGGMPSYDTSASDWVRYHGNYPGANIDFAAAAGDLWKNAVVMACLSWMQRAFPEAGLQVVERDGTEDEPIDGHALVELLDRPNPFTTGDQFWQSVIWDTVLGGNAYALKIRQGTGRVRELWHIPRARMTPTWNNTGSEFIGGYRMQVEGQDTALPAEDVIHFRVGKDPQNERLGYTPLASCLREIAILNEAVNYRSAILRNGAVGSHFVSPKERGGLTPDQAAALETKWLSKLTGQGRGRPIFTGVPADVHKLDYSPADLDLGQMTDEQANIVCAALGIPAMVVGIQAGEGMRSYANWGEARAAAMTENIIPLQKLIAETLTYSLLRPDFGGTPRQRVRFNVADIQALQEDENARWKRYVDAWQAGGITRATLKTAVGVDADPATDEVYFVPTNGSLVDATETPAERDEGAEAQRQQDEGLAAARLASLPETSGDAASLAMAPSRSAAAKALPAPALVQLDDEDWRRAEAVWNATMPELAGLLSARPR